MEHALEAHRCLGDAGCPDPFTRGGGEPGGLELIDVRRTRPSHDGTLVLCGYDPEPLTLPVEPMALNRLT